MDEFDSKVVPIRRNSSYLHQRALKNKRAGNYADALELLRLAHKRSPKNATYALDMAQLCSEMGLFEQSSRLLTQVMINDTESSECLYSMGLNLFRQGDLSRAESVLNAYIYYKNRRGARVSEAKSLLNEIQFSRDAFYPEQRKKQRAMRIVKMACNAMYEGDAKTGERLFEKSIAICDYSTEVHAMYALSLCILGKYDAARAEARKSIEDTSIEKFADTNIMAICISAQVFNRLGDRDEAVALITSALKLEANENEQHLLLSTLGEMGLHELVGKQAARMLSSRPYDKTLLHCSSAAAYNQNAPISIVLKGWQYIQRLDPDDPVCEYLISRVSSDNPPERPLEYVYALPREEVGNRMRYLADYMVKGKTTLTDAWKNDKRFRSIIEQELYSDNERIVRNTLIALSGIDDDLARAMIKVYAERPDVPIQLRRFALMMMQVFDIDPRHMLSEYFAIAAMPNEDELMSSLPVAQKQMIRYAADYIDEVYSRYPVTSIANIWLRYKSMRRGKLDTVGRTEVGSAALAMCYLKRSGMHTDLHEISRRFACPERQIERIVKSILEALSPEKN